MKEKLKTFVLNHIGEITIATTMASAVGCAAIWLYLDKIERG